MEQLMRTLEDMVRSGKVRYIGASNFAAWQLCRCNDIAERFGWERFISVQTHYNLLEREAEREMLPCCQALNIGFLPYYPLAGGLLTGRYEAGSEPPADSRAAFVYWARDYFDQHATQMNFATIGRLEAVAQECGHTLLELAIAWLLAQPGVPSVITGVSKVEHVVPDARAAAWHLSSEELAEVQACLRNTER
jgi:aryl-alcohol dehydrogenase-like predicted oxidoreductase